MSVLRVRAGSVLDLARTQGAATAAAVPRRLAADLAHAEGRTATPWDAFWNAVEGEATARRAYAGLDEETRALLDAYAEGVRRHLPGWRAWSSLGVFAVHHALFGSLGHHLWRRHVRRTLGPDAVVALAHEAVALSGSNAWLVGGARSADGAPLIGADPHRVLTVPGVYQRVRLVADDEGLDVVGLTFPGVPGVQHFAHTGTVAWAITNAMADTQHVEDDGRGGWAVRTVPGHLRDLGFGALLPLLRARTTRDVDAALDAWVEPVNDVLVADRWGTCLHRVAGRVPRRDPGHRWDDWVPPWREEIGPDGLAVTANHRRGPHSALLADEFAPPHRAQRLMTLLEEAPGPLSVEAAATLHADTLLLPAAAWIARLSGLDLGGPAAALREALREWDRRMDADSLGAGLFAAVRTALVRRLLRHRALAPLATPSPEAGELFAPWLRPEPRVALALDRWMAADAPFGIDLDAELAAATTEVATTIGTPRPWGASHTYTGPDGRAVPLGGDEGCVWSTASLPGLDDRVWRGPVARLVWCLGDRARSRWTVPDETAVWAAGRTSPLEDS